MVGQMHSASSRLTRYICRQARGQEKKTSGHGKEWANDAILSSLGDKVCMMHAGGAGTFFAHRAGSFFFVVVVVVTMGAGNENTAQLRFVFIHKQPEKHPCPLIIPTGKAVMKGGPICSVPCHASGNSDGQTGQHQP